MKSDLPTADGMALQLFRASHHSLDMSTGDAMLRRVIPVTLYVDGDSDRIEEVGQLLRNEIETILDAAGYARAGEWGPFSGSLVSTIFGRGSKAETGRSLQLRLRALVKDLRGLRTKLPPELLAGIRVVLVVGTFVTHLIGPAAMAAALPIVLPVAVIECIALAVDAADAAEAVREALEIQKSFHLPGGTFKF